MNFNSLFAKPDEWILLAVIIGAPLLGAFFNGVFGKRMGKPAVRLMALFAIGASFAASLATFFAMHSLRHKAEEAANAAWAAGHPGAEVPHDLAVLPTKVSWLAWKWLSMSGADGSGRIGIDVKFSVDELSGVMMLVVTGVGFLIHLYATSYMAKDPGYHRFFAYLNLFVFAMLTLILADNMPLLFVGWEGVGLCSYLLIGFWFEKGENAIAGRKAFIANRIGDVGMIGGMLILAYYTNALDWAGINGGVDNLVHLSNRITISREPMELVKWGSRIIGGALLLGALYGALSRDKTWRFAAVALGVLALAVILYGRTLKLDGPLTIAPATAACLAILLGCTGKSAQIPLYVWLPDAMAGPTPVSALIHAATMVTSGLYLICRLNLVFTFSPFAMMIVAIVGACTALFAATIALVQNDIKKVLAYSTVSQLGFMFLGVGVGAFGMGFFHVFTHAFFKACLFLGAGSVIHAMHARVHDDVKSQDMRHMGGLKKFMPYTYYAMGAATLAIAGMPLTSGFFSKDGILFHVWTNRVVHPATATAQTMLKDLGARHLENSAAYKKALLDSHHYFQAPEWLGKVLFAMGIVAATMTAFYMFRLLFKTFWGEFRGWKVDPKAALAIDPIANAEPLEEDDEHAAHGDHDEHAHDSHDSHDGHDSHAPANPPAEVPWQMAYPVAILAVFALFAGWLYAEPFHAEAMGHWLSPVFHEASHRLVQLREGAEKLEWPLMIPGVAAFAVGSYLAYRWYVLEGERVPSALTESYPRLYRAAYNKWYVDEIYDATIIGGTDALADGAALMDTWIVDGILAKLSSATVSALGAVLRAFQTGVVHVYAAFVALGTLAVVVFFVRPHPDVAMHKEGDTYVIEAAPGLGYEYKWDLGDEKADTDFVTGEDALKRTVSVPLDQTKKVTLEVRNAFGRVGHRTLELSNPKPQPLGLPSSSVGRPTPMPGGPPKRPIPNPNHPPTPMPGGGH